MQFNSAIFVGFFIVVYAAYLALRRDHRRQNLLLLVASYVFYGWWDWRFLLLLAFTTAVDFWIAQAMHATEGERRRRWLWVSLVSNLGVLGYFKYFNFFVGSAAAALQAVGLEPHLPALRVVLPVGISFYTFQSLSYTIDVYRGRLAPSRRLSDFALFVAFFPQLVAGPIERATRLLPAIQRPRAITVEQVDAGLYLLLWGYFQKLVVADNMAALANPIFADPAAYSGLDRVLATVAFAFQIYGDFAGYSNIARGLAKLMGFELMVNFRLPYLAWSPSDFWARWHISLSTWLRDYLYIPLGGNRLGRARTYVNLALTMLLGGLWHGASWTFVVWGGYHGLLLIGYRLLAERGVLRERPRGWAAFAAVGLMFVWTLIGWVFFRAASLSDALALLGGVGLDGSPGTAGLAYRMLWCLAPLWALEAWQHHRQDLLAPLAWRPWCRGLLYTLLVCWLCVFGAREPVEFIYFQF